MKSVNWRAAGSAQTWARASRKAGLAAGSAGAASGDGSAAATPGPSSPQSASTVSVSASADTAVATVSSRVAENGSSSLPAKPAVQAMPAIIISQTMVAAAARRGSATRLASSTSSEVPQALTPTPMKTKPTNASAMPGKRWLAIQAVAVAAVMPPSASRLMPPTIQGVRRPPTSEPKPIRGRSTCNR